jgi:hypothetical protein
MNHAALIPIADTIPVSWIWLNPLLLLTFTIHLLFMNVMLGITFISWVEELVYYYTRKQPVHGKKISSKLPVIIALTINIGVAPLLFLQVLYGQFIYVSSILMAAYWLSIPFILILAYYSAYLYKYKYEKYPGLRIFFISFSLIVFLLITFIFVNNMTMMLSPEMWSDFFRNSNGTLLNLAEPTIRSRYAHYLCASVAVGGLFLAVSAKLKKDSVEEIKKGLKWFRKATLVQMITGCWFLWQQPDPVLEILLSLSWPALFLFSAIFFALLALVFSKKQQVWLTIISIIICIGQMVMLRDVLRKFMLSPYFSITDLPENPQYSLFFLFLLILIIGLVVIAIMLKWAIAVKLETVEEAAE